MSGEDDLLERATRALRASAPPTETELAAGKGALLWAQRASQHKRRRGRTLRWVLPLAAVLAAGSALAHTTGQLERVAEVMSALLGGSTEKAERTNKRRPAGRALPARDLAPAGLETDATGSLAPPSAPSSADAATVASATAASPSTPLSAGGSTAALPEGGRQRAPRRAVKTPTVAPVEPAWVGPPEEYVREGEADEPTAAAPVPSADLARYREAHRAHFRARDFAAALRGWDAYLSEFPHGTFAIEARYNRAICLLRLERKDEARRALAPFARGREGRGYRQAEASKLLEALE